MAVSAKQMDTGNYAERRLLLQSCEAQGSKWSPGSGMEKKVSIRKVGKLTRKRVVEN